MTDMSDNFKAATRIKSGEKGDFDEWERGEDVSEDDFSEEEWDQLVASESVVTEERFAQMFPEHEAPVNQAMGTPSNLEVVEGTTLQAENVEDKPSSDRVVVPANPADPPVIEGAGTAEGFDTGSEDEDEDESEA